MIAILQGGPKVARHCVVVVTSQELSNKWLLIATLRRQISGTVHSHIRRKVAGQQFDNHYY